MSTKKGLGPNAKPLFDEMADDRKPKRGQCSVCMKTTSAECGRIICGNRKRETALPPGGEIGFPSSGRRTVTSRGEE